MPGGESTISILYYDQGDMETQAQSVRQCLETDALNWLHLRTDGRTDGHSKQMIDPANSPLIKLTHIRLVCVQLPETHTDTRTVQRSLPAVRINYLRM